MTRYLLVGLMLTALAYLTEGWLKYFRAKAAGAYGPTLLQVIAWPRPYLARLAIDDTELPHLSELRKTGDPITSEA